MTENLKSDVPPSWYKYEWPLPEVPGAPIPSKADYSQKNCAWLIEMFANHFIWDTGEPVTFDEVGLRYENNTPKNKSDDIFVWHPLDGEYLPKELQCKPKSKEMERYEAAAKKSLILKKFEENSPAKIKYWKDECDPTATTNIQFPVNGTPPGLSLVGRAIHTSVTGGSMAGGEADLNVVTIP